MASGWLSRNRSKLVQALRMTASSLGDLRLRRGAWAAARILGRHHGPDRNPEQRRRIAQGGAGPVRRIAARGRLWQRRRLRDPADDGLTRAVALVVAVAPLSFMAAYSAGFRVAPITAIIVLLSASGSTLGPLGFATDRVLEVGLGCAIGLLVSVLVVPARASRSVLETAAEVTRLLAEQLEAMAVPGDQAQANLSALAVRTRKSLNRLETLVGEAARERRSRLTDMPDPEPLLRTLMRLRHDVVMLRRAVGEPGA